MINYNVSTLIKIFYNSEAQPRHLYNVVIDRNDRVYLAEFVNSSLKMYDEYKGTVNLHTHSRLVLLGALPDCLAEGT